MFLKKERRECAVRVSDAHWALLGALEPKPHPVYSRRRKVPTVENMVVKSSFNGRIDLIKMCRLFQNVDYKPYKFAAMVIRIFPPRSTCLLFSNGRMVLTGVNSIETAAVAIMRILFMLYEAGFKPVCNGMRVANIVCSGLVGHDVDVHELSRVYSTTTVYRPLSFAGCVYEVDIEEVLQDFMERKLGSSASMNAACRSRLRKRKVRMLVFEGGSVVAMGLKSPREVDEVCKSMMQRLAVCRVEPAHPQGSRSQHRINAETRHIDMARVRRRRTPKRDRDDTKTALESLRNDYEGDTERDIDTIAMSVDMRALNLSAELSDAKASEKRARYKRITAIEEVREEEYQDMPVLG